MPASPAIYQPRKPQDSQYYQCVEDHFERFEQVYDDRLAKQYGFLRSDVKMVIYRYLDCAILHNGFARVHIPTHSVHLGAFSNRVATLDN